MKLFYKKDQSLKEVSPDPFKLERDIQSLVEKNINSIFGYLMIGSELTVGKYRIDSLCFDEENNSFVIVEYKKGSSYSVIDQGYTYLQLLLNNKSEFLLTLSHYFNKVMKIDDVDWSNSRIVFISPSFNSYQKDSVNFKNLPFELWEIKKFSEDIIILDQHHSTSKESIESLSDPANQEVISSVSKEIKTVDIEEHFSKSSEALIEKWRHLEERFAELDETYLESIPRYITLNYNKKKICFIRPYKDKIRFDLRRGNIHTDGKKQKNYFSLDDPKGISREKTWTYKSGQQGGSYNISFTKDTDIEYFMFLIKQKYSQIVNQ